METFIDNIQTIVIKKKHNSQCRRISLYRIDEVIEAMDKNIKDNKVLMSHFVKDEDFYYQLQKTGASYIRLRDKMVSLRKKLGSEKQ